LPVADDFQSLNVAAEIDDSTSLLTLYRRWIELRRAEPALSVGAYRPLPANDELMAYLRQAGDRRLLIVLNFSTAPHRFDLKGLHSRPSRLLSTRLDRAREALPDELELRGDEGVVIALR
jgi:alpha-glucosidase